MKDKTFIAAGDFHFPYVDKKALNLFLKAFENHQPEHVYLMGDLIDAEAFSSHNPDKFVPGRYSTEITQVINLIDTLLSKSWVKKLFVLEGNHEDRIFRMVARDRTLCGLSDLLLPSIVLSQRFRDPRFTYHTKRTDQKGRDFISPLKGLVLTHGWSACKHAAAAHMRKLGGNYSVIYGHTHRTDVSASRSAIDGHRIMSASGGCMCQLWMPYLSEPSEWNHGYVYGYGGNSKSPLFTVYPLNT